MSYRTVILGASGYTGAELVRLLANHPSIEISALGADRKAGLSMAAVFPHLAHLRLPDLATLEEIDFSGIDLAFCALPHQTSQAVISQLPRDLRIIDLSADFRLRDPASYETWYGKPHQAEDLQAEAVYGLTEFYRQAIREARLVAGTGCNAAAGQYALRPLIERGIIDLDDIIIDLKAGVSGAGRALRENLLFAELGEGANPYGVGGTHRHLGEFDQEFTEIAGREVSVQFTPHLLPMNRGILATVYVRGDAGIIREAMSDAYRDEPFIQILPDGSTPSTHHVRGSNFVHIGISGDRRQDRSIVFVALDNLVKGSSGQAVQNANLMLNEEETAGLLQAPLFP